jgi:glyoxylase-like metal-dependent hydrolase (beta-lactamase superfamily II)
MSPRVPVRSLIAAAVLALLAWPLHAQQPTPAPQARFADVVIRAVPIAPGIAMLLGAGGNIGVCTGEDGVILIDDQFAELSERIKAKVDSISGGKPIRFVVNTHWHGDHVGGNEKLGQAGAVILAQDNVRRRMSAMQFMSAVDTVPPSPPRALPIVTFTDSVTLHVNGYEMRVFHVRNAHTDGDVMIYFPEADALHMGDCLFNGRYPLIDVLNGGTLDGMIAADDVALKLVKGSTKIIPGHGPLADKAVLQSFRDMLAKVRDRLKPLVRQGKTADQIIALHPLADIDSTWGKGNIKPDRFIRIVVDDLTRQRARR